MLNEQQYVVQSLEQHLFFGRIMKEHAIFLEAGFTPKNSNLARTADNFKLRFEAFLSTAVQLSNGIISTPVLHSGEIITDFTLGSEQKTQNFSGIQINTNITQAEKRLTSSMNPVVSPALVRQVQSLNSSIMSELNRLIDFKTMVLNGMLSCNMFTMNYPLLIDHIIREAKMYRTLLIAIEDRNEIDENPKNTELFWDQIMLEHALFIRGLLDPSEGELINTANDFALDYQELINRAAAANDIMLSGVSEQTLEQTKAYRDFKAAGTKGINECKIRSIIIPLLADHVLREANHYIRLLEQA